MQDKKVEVAYVYNGRAVKVKNTAVDFFKKIKPKAETEVVINNENKK